MAQAATDLPEITQEATASPADADELLSQLAGSEIDRLLAEADDKPATPPPAPQPAAPEPQDDKPQAAPEGPERAALLEAAGFDGAAAAATQEEGDSQDPSQDAPAAGSERSAVLRAAGFQQSDAAESLASGLDQPLDAEALEAETPMDIEAEAETLPFYLKPLAWINAPLDACPAGVRMIVGKAAIVTLVNALAVLAYVVFFRKH